MDIKKIDKIKAPEDWVEEALNPEMMITRQEVTK